MATSWHYHLVLRDGELGIQDARLKAGETVKVTIEFDPVRPSREELARKFNELGEKIRSQPGFVERSEEEIQALLEEMKGEE